MSEDAAVAVSDAESRYIKTDPTLNDGRTRSKFGLVAVGITGTVVSGLFLGTIPFLTPALRKICLPYVPATSSQVANILRLCKGRSGTFVDLGSGDGRVFQHITSENDDLIETVLAAASAGFQAVGYELNPWLVLYSKLKARFQRLHHKALFYRADLWKTNLKDFDNIIIFGVEEMMPRLQTKLAEEMKPDARILACRFPLPDWDPEAEICAGIDTVWRYRKCRSLNEVQHVNKNG